MSLAGAFAKKVAPLAVPQVVPTGEAAVAAAAAAEEARKAAALAAASAGVGHKRPRAVEQGEGGGGGDDAAEEPHLSRRDKWRRLDVERDPYGDEDKAARTVFVGNLPVTTTAKELTVWIQSGGVAKPAAAGDGGEAATTVDEGATPVAGLAATVESIRFRSVPIAAVAVTPGSDYRKMIKAAVMTGSLAVADGSKEGATGEKNVTNTMNAYVVFKAAEAAELALALNGRVFHGRHVRVDRANKPPTYDYKRTIFLGNLPYGVTEEGIRSWVAAGLSRGMDGVVAVRIVRDKVTHVGKGIAYVLLKERTLMAEALALHMEKYDGRPIRVVRCTATKDKDAPAAMKASGGAAGGSGRKAGAGGGGRDRSASPARVKWQPGLRGEEVAALKSGKKFKGGKGRGKPGLAKGKLPPRLAAKLAAAGGGQPTAAAATTKPAPAKPAPAKSAPAKPKRGE